MPISGSRMAICSGGTLGNLMKSDLPFSVKSTLWTDNALKSTQWVHPGHMKQWNHWQSTHRCFCNVCVLSSSGVSFSSHLCHISLSSTPCTCRKNFGTTFTGVSSQVSCVHTALITPLPKCTCSWNFRTPYRTDKEVPCNCSTCFITLCTSSLLVSLFKPDNRLTVA